MVIIALLWNVGNKAQALRDCTGCMARGLSFQEREFQEPKEVPNAPRRRRGRSRRARSRSCPSRQRTHPPGGGNRRSRRSEFSSRKRVSRRQKFVLEMLIFMGRL